MKKISFKEKVEKKLLADSRFDWEDGELVHNDHNIHLMNFIQFLYRFGCINYKQMFIDIAIGILEVLLNLLTVIFSPIIYVVSNYIDYKKQKKRILRQYSKEELEKITKVRNND